MIPLPLAELAPLGRVEAAPWAVEVTGVRVDSRLVEEGDLFVAIGPGADYVKHAFARGAAAVLVPGDAHGALAALGRAVRDRSGARIVAVTGSVGKTSTKDLLGAMCAVSARTIAAEHGFNQEIGVPLTVCRIEPDTEVAVVEMGMRGLGQIRALCEIAQPHVGVITAIAPVHLGLLGTLERIAEAKAEVVAGLLPGGVALVPAGIPELDPFLEREGVEIRRFGEGGDYRVREVTQEEGTTRIDFTARGEPVRVTFPRLPRHQVGNALAALAGYDALGLPLGELDHVEPSFSRWRGDEVALQGGGLLINDAWNANPPAMRAALEHLAERAAGRRIVAVLGTMAELGPDSPRYHEEIGRLVSELGVDVLVAVGEPARAYLGGSVATTRWVPDAEHAVEALAEVLEPGDCVLVKGSRAVGLEIVAEAAVV